MVSPLGKAWSNGALHVDLSYQSNLTLGMPAGGHHEWSVGVAQDGAEAHRGFGCAAGDEDGHCCCGKIGIREFVRAVVATACVNVFASLLCSSIFNSVGRHSEWRRELTPVTPLWLCLWSALVREKPVLGLWIIMNGKNAGPILNCSTISAIVGLELV